MSKRKRSVDDIKEELEQYAKTDEEIEELLKIHKANPDISAYECRRKLNIINNEKVLKGLGIVETKRSLVVKKKILVKKEFRPKVAVALLPSRRSNRLQNVEAVQYTKEIIENLKEDPGSTQLYYRPRKPAALAFTESCDVGSEEAKPLLDQMKLQPDIKHHDQKEHELHAELQKLSCGEGDAAKVCKKKLYSLDVHPDPSRVLAVSGSKDGEVGLFMPGGDATSLVFNAHVSTVSCVKFNNGSVSSCSYDGTVKLFDIEQLVWRELYATAREDDILLRYLGLKGVNELLVARADGQVTFIDVRAPESCTTVPLSRGGVYSIDVNKFNENYFVTATGSGESSVTLWDARKCTGYKDAVGSIEHSKMVSSAFFDKVTGNKILSTSTDDSIRVIDCKDKTGLTGLKSIHHNNWTGRWIAKFKARWHPRSDTVFCVGSMVKFPERQIDVVSTSGEMIATLTSDYMVSIQSHTVWHPNLNVLVGGNGSGYNYVFRG